MKSWHLSDLVRTVEQYPKKSHPRRFYALAEIGNRGISNKELKSIATELMEKYFRNLLESRSYIYQGLDLPSSYYLSAEEVKKILDAEIVSYQDKMGDVNINLGMYMG